MKPSLQSKIFALILKAGNFKKIVESRAAKPLTRSKKGFIPNRIKRSYSWRLQTIHAKEIATFESKEEVRKNHIIFYHGGAYIFEASPYHWQLAELIVKKSFCRMTLVDYPLAPEHTYKDTFETISRVYTTLVMQYPDDNFILMGDSAGGGLALAFAQKLIQEKHEKLPSSIVLLSPWLDLTLSNPEIKKLESRDFILSVQMLQNAAMKYSKGDDPDQYLLSPINGNLDHLPKTLVFFGTEELFHADCLKLKSLMADSKQKHVFREYENMQHDWAIFPIPERNELVDEI
jgi:acetyl esterase/lipase